MEPQISPGYILIEGLDFTGKSTIAQRLAEKLSSVGPVNAQYKKGFFHNNRPEETETLAAELDSRYKEMYFKSMYALDKARQTLPHDLVIQDRYFPSILFYGMMVNNSHSMDHSEMKNNFILPRHVLLFECSYDAKKERANSRDKFRSLERMVLESEEKHKIMQQAYRDIIQETGVGFTLIDTSDKDESGTLNECYNKLASSDILLEDVQIGDLFVSWESRIYPSTANKYSESLENGSSLKPLVIHRVFNKEIGIVRDLIEDGRHRAYAHYLSGRKTAKAFVQRIPVNKEYIDSVKLTSLKDFGVK
jgi:thymidylate kinase